MPISTVVRRRAGAALAGSPPELALKLSSLGFRHFASDMMWLASIQYYGAQRNVEDGHFRLLVPFLEQVVALDPLFEYAYRFGGVAAVGQSGEMSTRRTGCCSAWASGAFDVWKIPYIRSLELFAAHGRPALHGRRVLPGGGAAARVPSGSGSSQVVTQQAQRATEAFDSLARLVENTDDPLLKLRWRSA